MISYDILNILSELLANNLEEFFTKKIKDYSLNSFIDEDEDMKHTKELSSECLDSTKDIVNDSIIKNNIIMDQYKEEKQGVYNTKEENNEAISDVDIVMIFALPEERKGFFRAFSFLNSQDRYTEMGKFYYQINSYKNLKIISITQTKMGIAMASSLTTRAIMTFHPKLVVMTGICAGRKDETNIGDVLLASSVYDYTAGKITEQGKILRPDPIQCNGGFLNIYRQKTEHENDEKLNNIINELWGSDSARPTTHSKVYSKSLGTGSSVVADSKIIEEAIKNQDNLYGIDMEGYGVAVAASELNTTFFIAKGVQDFANHEKRDTENKNNAREYACLASAVLAKLIVPEFIARNPNL